MTKRKPVAVLKDLMKEMASREHDDDLAYAADVFRKASPEDRRFMLDASKLIGDCFARMRAALDAHHADM